MKSLLRSLIPVATSFALAANAGEQPAAATAAPIVFFDIAGPDNISLGDFFKNVFGWSVQADGRFEAPVVATSVPALIRKDPADKVIYIGVGDITATLTKIAAHGGTIAAPRFEVPGVVVLGLFHDPAGNRFGLVEMKDGKAIVP